MWSGDDSDGAGRMMGDAPTRRSEKGPAASANDEQCSSLAGEDESFRWMREVGLDMDLGDIQAGLTSIGDDQIDSVSGHFKSMPV